jgi:hypothetical protein
VWTSGCYSNYQPYAPQYQRKPFIIIQLPSLLTACGVVRSVARNWLNEQARKRLKKRAAALKMLL